MKDLKDKLNLAKIKNQIYTYYQKVLMQIDTYKQKQQEKENEVKIIIDKKERKKITRKKDLPILKDKVKKPKEQLQGKQKVKAIIRTALLSLLVLIISGIFVVGMIFYSWYQDAPELDTSLLMEAAQSSVIYDINKKPIATFSSSETRQWVPLEEIPEDLINAFISVEDTRFYSHIGVDVKRLGSAVLGQISGADHGGSTITQQLIKNVYLSSETTYKRKFTEIVMALRLESKLSKDEILEAYLNIIYFGGSNYGVKAAATDYFGKELDELSLKECACLAGIVKNPNGYSPRNNMYVYKDMTPTIKRTETVLYTMEKNKAISKKEYDEAVAEEFVVMEESATNSIYKYPHFVEYVISDVVKDMIIADGEEINGTSLAVYEWKIRSGGYQIYTMLDPIAQNALQESASTYTKYPVLKEDNSSTQTAAVIMDQKTGNVVAMIGSKDEPKAYKTLNRATTSTMPVASIIKPLSAYAVAIENGKAPGSIGYNYATKVEGYDIHTDYPAGNMGVQKPMTYREALQTSSNVVPASIIATDFSYEMSAEYLVALGIPREAIQVNGSGLVLGTSGITMLDMTAAYATIASGGIYREPKAYTTVVDRYNETILSATNYQEKREVFSKSTAWLLTDALQSVIGVHGVEGVNGITTAGKTGTHEDKCATFAGYTNDYVSTVWIGSDSYSSYVDIGGAANAAPLFTNYMNKIYKEKKLKDKPILDYTYKDADIVCLETCCVSGLLATEHCNSNGCKMVEYYKNGTQPTEYCNMHISTTMCKSSHKLACEHCPGWATYEGTILFIPKSSPLSNIPVDLVRKTFPNAYFESQNPYCHIHNPATAGIYNTIYSILSTATTKTDEIKVDNRTTQEETWKIANMQDSINSIRYRMNNANTDSELYSIESEANILLGQINTLYAQITTRIDPQPVIPEEPTTGTPLEENSDPQLENNTATNSIIE